MLSRSQAIENKPRQSPELTAHGVKGPQRIIVVDPDVRMDVLVEVLQQDAAGVGHLQLNLLVQLLLQLHEAILDLGGGAALLIEIEDAAFEKVVGRISFFVKAGIRLVTELCKMRAFTELWDESARERYGVTDEKYRRFRYGVQVNSLGLTEQIGRASCRERV